MKCNKWKPILLIAVSMAAAAQTPEDLDEGAFFEFLGEFGIDDEWLDPLEVEKWSEQHADTTIDADSNYRNALKEHHLNERTTPSESSDRSRWLSLDETTEFDESEDESDEEN
ncbi:MAG: hypothetical protein HKN70_14855 [Gammaproteobacteria bacterium]|nr:hypothetical protein [Gammaproteobacteria bacterium]